MPEVKPNDASAAQTDISTLIGDLDGGQFERQLSAAVSMSAAAAVDNNRQAEVLIKLVMKPIEGSKQVQIIHTLKMSRPTETGKSVEDGTRKTTMHVGRFGKLTLAPENQMQMFDRSGSPASQAPGTPPAQA